MLSSSHSPSAKLSVSLFTPVDLESILRFRARKPQKPKIFRVTCFLELRSSGLKFWCLPAAAGMPSRKRKGVPGKCSLPPDYQHPAWVGGGGPGLPAWLLQNMAAGMGSSGSMPMMGGVPGVGRTGEEGRQCLSIESYAAGAIMGACTNDRRMSTRTRLRSLRRVHRRASAVADGSMFGEGVGALGPIDLSGCFT